MPPDTWNLSGTQGNVVAIHVTCSIHHGYPIKEFFTQRIKVPQVESQSRRVQGDLSREVKNELEAQYECLCFAGRPSMNSFLPAEIPQNSMAVLQKTANIGAAV